MLSVKEQLARSCGSGRDISCRMLFYLLVIGEPRSPERRFRIFTGILFLPFCYHSTRDGSKRQYKNVPQRVLPHSFPDVNA